MTDLGPAVPLPEPVEAEFLTLLDAARASGRLSLDALVHALKDVEFNPELIEGLRKACRDAGVILDEEHDSPVPEEISVPDQPNQAAPEELDLDAPIVDQARVDRAAAFAASIGDDVEDPSRRHFHDRARRGEWVGSDDSVRLYMKEIGQVALLDARQEVRVAARIRRGLEAEAAVEALVEAGMFDEVDPAEAARFKRLVRDGHRATDELIRANLRLVVSIAKRYVNRGMGLLDLVQEGNLGLMRAVEKFDHTKGFKFSTYATWWIRQAITRAIADQARTIRIPVHMVDAMNRIRHLQRQMHQDLKREPTVEELAAEVDEPVEKIRELLRIGLDTLSLDLSVGEEDNSELVDFIEDHNAAAPIDVAARQMLAIAVGEVLVELSDREQEVVRLRFGLDDGCPRTLKEVARQFGVTRERIRQIETKTLAKLRHPHRSGRLRDYLEDA